jgi:hypothetical protein
MTINTGAISKLLRPGINSAVGLAYNMYPPEWSEIFDVAEASDMNYEEDIVMYGTGMAPVKQQSAPIAFDSMQQAGYVRYTHITYGIGYSITREAVEDNLYVKQAMEIANQMAFSCKQTYETICANILNKSTSSGQTGWDGVSLLNTAHLLAKGGTWNNTLLVAANLSEASAEQALIDIGNFVNDAGMHVAFRGMKMIIPINLQFEAERIFMSPDRYNTAERSINAMNNMGVLPGGVHVNHYLSSPTNASWYIKTDALKGLRLFERRPIEVSNDTPDFCTENMDFKATFRISAGWTDPRGVYGVYL